MSMVAEGEGENVVAFAVTTPQDRRAGTDEPPLAVNSFDEHWLFVSAADPPRPAKKKKAAPKSGVMIC